MYRLLFIVILFSSCHTVKKMQWPQRNEHAVTGTEFYKQAFPMKWQQRDSFVLKEVLSGNIPAFLKKFTRIETEITDSSASRKIKAEYFVAPDYLSIGSNEDWARINITPRAAQKIADSLGCFLPTR